MSAGKPVFMVIFFSRNRRLLMALAALTAIVLAVWLLVSAANHLVGPADRDQTVPWSVVYHDPHWQGEPGDRTLPRYFIGGGVTYDEKILVDGWGLSAEVIVPVDYMEDLGVHVLFGQVLRVTYTPGRLQIYVSQEEKGYQMIKLSKVHLQEGDLQVVFLNSKGVPIRYEEEYIYSIPLVYDEVARGQGGDKASASMEILDSETVPALAQLGLEASVLNPWRRGEHVLLLVYGGNVTSIQRTDLTVRIYTGDQPVWQVVAIKADQLQTGQNSLRLIGNSDLKVRAQVVFWHNTAP